MCIAQTHTEIILHYGNKDPLFTGYAIGNMYCAPSVAGQLLLVSHCFTSVDSDLNAHKELGRVLVKKFTEMI